MDLSRIIVLGLIKSKVSSRKGGVDLSPTSSASAYAVAVSSRKGGVDLSADVSINGGADCVSSRKGGVDLSK